MVGNGLNVIAGLLACSDITLGFLELSAKHKFLGRFLLCCCGWWKGVCCTVVGCELTQISANSGLHPHERTGRICSSSASLCSRLTLHAVAWLNSQLFISWLHQCQRLQDIPNSLGLLISHHGRAVERILLIESNMRRRQGIQFGGSQDFIRAHGHCMSQNDGHQGRCEEGILVNQISGRSSNHSRGCFFFEDMIDVPVGHNSMGQVSISVLMVFCGKYEIPIIRKVGKEIGWRWERRVRWGGRRCVGEIQGRVEEICRVKQIRRSVCRSHWHGGWLGWCSCSSGSSSSRQIDATEH